MLTSSTAALDPDLCSGSEACIDLFQMEALQMNSSGIAEIDHDRCIVPDRCSEPCCATGGEEAKASGKYLRAYDYNGQEQGCAVRIYS